MEMSVLMSNKYERISPTAIGVAYLRAQFTNMPFSKEILEKIKKFSQVPFLAKIPPPLTHLAIFFPRSLQAVAGMEIRYLSVNNILNQLDETWAIVEIAAGLTPRALEWSGEHFIYIDTDLPHMLKIKKRVFHEILQNNSIEFNSRHVFETLNALEFNGWEQLGKTYFSDKKMKIAVINEGLLGYLTLEEKRSLRDNIKKFFDLYAIEGKWITTDFSSLNLWRATRIVRRFQKNIEQVSGRNFHFFKNRTEVIEFLQEGGFHAKYIDNDAILDKLTCIPKMHLNKRKIRNILKRFQVCSAAI